MLYECRLSQAQSGSVKLPHSTPYVFCIIPFSIKNPNSGGEGLRCSYIHCICTPSLGIISGSSFPANCNHFSFRRTPVSFHKDYRFQIITTQHFVFIGAHTHMHAQPTSVNRTKIWLFFNKNRQVRCPLIQKRIVVK